MQSSQQNLLKTLDKLQEEVTKGYIEYWKQYSSFDTWQFWFNLTLLIFPLVILFLKIDRSRAMLLGFYGYNVHVWFSYIDSFGVNLNYWTYPYHIIPIRAVNFALDVSLIPVLYMFLYQWIINSNKHYYLYGTGLSLFLAFIFKPILVAMGLFQLNNGANYFHLFIGYLTVMLLSKWITNIFIYFEKK
ncbi:CBO0543 family protein [Aquibacillus kalidii]|uniref:CBO0543 family protein n=1 Tax=Aquibacillus kalidii TaxID=2762597 RepID=UPI0016457554|nr:CBO0543 family protein [Aquibacillus kalidii]